MRKSLIAELNKTFMVAIKRTSDEGLLIFPWENKEFYCRWLAQTYYMVRHTTRFLCLTGAKFSFEDQKLHQFCLNHLKEEAGHELLAKKDLEILGDKLKQLPPSPETEYMIQNQYYWINKTPFAHFGFFWVLEQLSVLCGNQIIERVHKAHGTNCTSFLDLHASEDVKHTKTIYSKVQAFPEHELESLISNIRQTGFAYSEMLKTLQKPNYSLITEDAA